MRTIDNSDTLHSLLDEVGLPGGSSDAELLDAIDRGSPTRELTADEFEEVMRLRINESLRKAHER